MRVRKHICDKLSDWEVAELYVLYRGGTSKRVLAMRYGMSASTLNDVLRRFENAWHEMREAVIQT